MYTHIECWQFHVTRFVQIKHLNFDSWSFSKNNDFDIIFLVSRIALPSNWQKSKKNILRHEAKEEESWRSTIIAFNGWCESVGEREGRRGDDRSLRRLIIIIMARAAERWARVAASWGVRSGPCRVARKRVDGMRFTRLCIDDRRYPWSIPMLRMLAIIA